MDSRTLAQTTLAMADYIRREVAGGFSTPDEVADTAVDVFSEEQPPAVLRPLAERLTKEALAAHRAAQASWPAVTDCDRLERAFAELERAGVVCRQNFTCCGT